MRVYETDSNIDIQEHSIKIEPSSSIDLNITNVISEADSSLQSKLQEEINDLRQKNSELSRLLEESRQKSKQLDKVKAENANLNQKLQESNQTLEAIRALLCQKTK